MPAALRTQVAAAQTMRKATSDPASNEIIVTGLPLDEGQNKVSVNGALGDKTLLDTPYSITVVDKDDIARRQATTIAQIFVNDPSISSFATAGTTNWWGTQIRGLGVRNYYVDGVPLLLYWGGDFPLESIETVEALKGLTGFMYGFGAPGGVISYRTKRATAKPQLTTEFGYRSNSDFFAHLDAGGPVAADGRLGYRINLAGEKGTVYNQAGVERWLASLALDYQLGANLRWYATGTYEDRMLRHEPFQVYWSAYQDSVLPKVTYDYGRLNIDNSFYQARTLSTATELDWTFARNWSAQLAYGYTSKQHHSNKTFADMLNSAGDYNGYVYNFAEMDRNHFAQAMVQGKFETGPLRHSIVAGASFMAYNSEFGLNDYYYDNDFDGNIYQNQPFKITRFPNFNTGGGPFQERQRAVFLSDTLYIGDHVQLVGGARYTRYEIRDTDGDPSVASGYRVSALTPTAALIYKPAGHVSIYGSYVEAMEPGSRVGGLYANVGEILPATVSRQYEAGVKYEHGGVSLTGAAFRIERANQIDRIVGGLRYLRQDGLTVYKGLEGIASYRVTKNLRLGVGAIHLDAKIREVSPENADLIGHMPAEAAKWQLLGNAEYHVAAVPGLSVHGNIRYFDKAPVDTVNALFIPSRTLANIGVQYEARIGGRKVLFTGNVNNLFNVKYWGLGNFGESMNGSVSARIHW